MTNKAESYFQDQLSSILSSLGNKPERKMTALDYQLAPYASPFLTQTQVDEKYAGLRDEVTA